MWHLWLALHKSDVEDEAELRFAQNPVARLLEVGVYVDEIEGKRADGQIRCLGEWPGYPSS